MHAADGTFFTSASAYVVAHLLLKSRSKTVIGCSWKMKRLALPSPEVQASQRVCGCALASKNVTMLAKIIQTSAVVVISIFGDISS
jgi:hypothetical protein